MALDFPSSPSANQIYQDWYWDATNSVWRLLGDSLEIAANFSNTATGTYTDGFDYKYVSFTSNGTLTVTRGGYADILLVGGGGSGGHGWAGGGGAGGHLYIENAYLPAGALDVVVGAGGLAVNNRGISDFSQQGLDGEPSSLWDYFVPGGGGGASYQTPYNSASVYAKSGNLGASGGGASGYSSGSAQPGGSGIVGIGNAGGTGAGSSGAAGGGGGAGEVGAAGVGSGGSSVGGDGGDGVSNSITGSAVTRAGGGGGASSATAGAGGAGGGGAGAINFDTATSGTANTGGGGGGAWHVSSSYSGAGGSGIVIVRVRTN